MNLLSLAASHGQESVVKLLEYGASADSLAIENKQTPLSLVAGEELLSIVQPLAETHCDLNFEGSTGYTPLVYARNSWASFCGAFFA